MTKTTTNEAGGFSWKTIAAPVAGLVYLVALPVVGVAMIGWAVARKLAGGAKETAADLASTVAPGWTPGEAHLSGKPGGEEQAGRAPGLDKLEADIEAKRGDAK